ncbi:MAG TPA: glycerophosphodiester phosphodiesterase family protein [Pseudomonadales bacterium]
MPRADQFVAHRGYARHYPENTLTAITAAIHAGARHVEVDIQFSRDGVPLLYHDVDMQRVSAVAGKVFDFDAAELVEMPAFEPGRFGRQFRDVPISLASEFAHLVAVKAGVHFYVELKSESIDHFGVTHCLACLQETLAPVLRQCTLIGDDHAAMLLAKQQYGFPATGLVFRDWARRDELIRRYHADIAYINIQRIPAGDAITAACPIAVYEIDQPAQATTALQRGAALVETFAIGELIEALC